VFHARSICARLSARFGAATSVSKSSPTRSDHWDSPAPAPHGVGDVPCLGGGNVALASPGPIGAAATRRMQRSSCTASVNATACAAPSPASATSAHVGKMRLPVSVPIGDAMAAWSADTSRTSDRSTSGNARASAPGAPMTGCTFGTSASTQVNQGSPRAGGQQHARRIRRAASAALWQRREMRNACQTSRARIITFMIALSALHRPASPFVIH
jgi:hypothetical protein